MTEPRTSLFASIVAGPAGLARLVRLARHVLPAASMALVAIGGCAEDAEEIPALELTVDLEASPFTVSWPGGPVDLVEMWRCERDCDERCVNGMPFTGVSTLRWRVDTSDVADPDAGITSPLTYGEPVGGYPEAFGPLESGRVYAIQVLRGGPAAGEDRDAEATGCVAFEAP